MCHAANHPSNNLRRRRTGGGNPRRTGGERRLVHNPTPPVPGDTKERWRAAIERFGLRTFILAAGGPASLHLVEVVILRSSPRADLIEPFSDAWVLDVMDLINAGTSLLMSMCCWFAWAEMGVIQRRPYPAKLVRYYVGSILLSVAWGPIVFGLGALWVGLLASATRTWFAAVIAWLILDLNARACMWALYCTFVSLLVGVMTLKVLIETYLV